ncbi:MAG: Gfo/Idh/MocA family oxidoreductase [Planctomycetaceae bacterium]
MSEVSRRQLIKGAAAVAGSLVLPGAHAAPVQNAKIRVGQIGVGHAHASKLSVYRSSADYEVVGIVEPNEGLRKRAEGQDPYRDLPWMTTEQLLNEPGLQVVLVETEVRDLLNTAEVCIAAGKHVHLDKPAGESLIQYQKILKAAEAAGLMVQMGYMYRYSPAVMLLRDFLKQGWLGDVFEVHTVMSKVVPESGRRALAAYPGGIMFELGCHIIDLVIGILGAPNTVTAWGQHVSPVRDDLQDNMLAVLQYEKALASVKSSAVEVDGGSRRHLVVCGTEGTFHIQPLDNPRAQVTLSQSRGDYRKGAQEIEFPKYSRYVGDAADMAKIIRGEKQCDFSYAHDFDVQKTVLEASGVKQ